MKKHLFFSVLLLTICLIIIISACFDNSLFAATKGKTSGKKAKAKTSYSYTTLKFDPNCTSLPPRYLGHDFSKVFNILKQRTEKLEKGEFETTEQFKKREDRENSKPILGNLTIDDYFVFSQSFDNHVTLSFNYNADLSVIEIEFHAYREQYWKGDPFSVCINTKSDFTGDYIGQNAMGAKIRVHKHTDIESSVLLTEPSISLPSSFKLENIQPYKAKELKENIRVLFVFKLKPPYQDSYINVKPATFDYEFEDTTYYEWLFADMKQVIVYDFKTGEILDREREDSKNTETDTETETPKEQ
jgi:hypothetical protein